MTEKGYAMLQEKIRAAATVLGRRLVIEGRAYFTDEEQKDLVAAGASQLLVDSLVTDARAVWTYRGT